MKQLYIAIILILTASTSHAIASQTGTYEMYDDKTGASSTIAVEQKGTKITADVFAWWHTESGRHGVFIGEGELKNNTAILRSDDPDDGDTCKVTLNFDVKALKAGFDDCIANNIPEDFSGPYKKITDMIPGEYVVTVDKAYFYKEPNLKHRMKAYLVRGDKITLDIENIQSNGWTFINFVSPKGKSTNAFMQLSSFSKDTIEEQ